MTQPVFTPLPLGNPPDPLDRVDNKIDKDSPIAYAVGDGYLHVGVVRDVIHKVVDAMDYDSSSPTYRQRIPSWSTRLKVEVANEKYSHARHVNLTKMTNVIVLDGPYGVAVKKQIEESWLVDEP